MVRRGLPWAAARTLTPVQALRARRRRSGLEVIKRTPEASAARGGIGSPRGRPQRGKALSHTGWARWVRAVLGPDPPPPVPSLPLATLARPDSRESLTGYKG